MESFTFKKGGAEYLCKTLCYEGCGVLLMVYKNDKKVLHEYYGTEKSLTQKYIKSII